MLEENNQVELLGNFEHHVQSYSLNLPTAEHVINAALELLRGNFSFDNLQTKALEFFIEGFLQREECKSQQDGWRQVFNLNQGQHIGNEEKYRELFPGYFDSAMIEDVKKRVRNLRDEFVRHRKTFVEALQVFTPDTTILVNVIIVILLHIGCEKYA